MKISELDDLALSRLIAEEIGYVYGVCGCCGALGTLHWHEPISMSECLCAVDTDENMIASEEHGAPCRLPDFVTDPAMRDLLQEKLLEDLWSLRIQMLQGGYEMECESEKYQRAFTVMTATRARLWPEAYALAHGLGEK